MRLKRCGRCHTRPRHYTNGYCRSCWVAYMRTYRWPWKYPAQEVVL